MAYSVLGGGSNIFIRGKNALGGRKKISGLSDNRGAEYLNITKDRLDLASAPYVPNDIFICQGQKHTI